MELAIATQTSPADWWGEDSETIATALEILERQAADVKKAGRKRGK